MHFMVRFAEVVTIVCANDGKIKLFRQLYHYGVRLSLLVNIMVLDLNVEIPFSHYLHQRLEVLDTFFSAV